MAQSLCVGKTYHCSVLNWWSWNINLGNLHNVSMACFQLLFSPPSPPPAPFSSVPGEPARPLLSLGLLSERERKATDRVKIKISSDMQLWRLLLCFPQVVDFPLNRFSKIKSVNLSRSLLMEVIWTLDFSNRIMLQPCCTASWGNRLDQFPKMRLVSIIYKPEIYGPSY